MLSHNANSRLIHCHCNMQHISVKCSMELIKKTLVLCVENACQHFCQQAELHTANVKMLHYHVL